LSSDDKSAGAEPSDWPQAAGSPGRLREVVAQGGPRELGLQHGQAARDLIRASYSVRMRHASAFSTESAVLARGMRYLPFAERYAPELIEEVNGIADGAGMTFERTFFLQVATELELTASGCTALGVSTSRGGPMLAQNWDQPSDSRNNQIILHLRPSDRPEIVIFAHAGVIGYLGLNSSGVGNVQNQLFATERPLGLTGYFVTRKLLGFDSIADGLCWLEDIELGSCGNYLLGDAEGNIADIELGDGIFRRLEPEVRGHTNHYLLTDWLTPDRAESVVPDSKHRLKRLNSLLATSGDHAMVIDTLRDHEGYPASICRHEDDPGTRTLASLVLRLQSRELDVCYGNPCVGDYHTYQLIDQNASPKGIV
jgi:isopenicillin-N N-acyltransferase like protein